MLLSPCTFACPGVVVAEAMTLSIPFDRAHGLAIAAYRVRASLFVGGYVASMKEKWIFKRELH
jgi:hypothetical protein